MDWVILAPLALLVSIPPLYGAKRASVASMAITRLALGIAGDGNSETVPAGALRGRTRSAAYSRGGMSYAFALEES